MALHTICNTTNMMCWDVDALNMTGINATTDIDNGTLVTLTKIAKTEAGDITGYQYEVAPAAANAVNVWLVATPEIGKTLEMQVHDDIRYFYNKAGLPMDIKGIVAGFDCFEVDATAFANSTLPTNSQIGQLCGVATNGKFTAPAASVTSGATFRVEGLHTITCGADEVKTAVLRCMKNA